LFFKSLDEMRQTFWSMSKSMTHFLSVKNDWLSFSLLFIQREYSIVDAMCSVFVWQMSVDIKIHVELYFKTRWELWVENCIREKNVLSAFSDLHKRLFDNKTDASWKWNVNIKISTLFLISRICFKLLLVKIDIEFKFPT
jgi:hypothetical protein